MLLLLVTVVAVHQAALATMKKIDQNQVKKQQSRYRPGVAQRVPGS